MSNTNRFIHKAIIIAAFNVIFLAFVFTATAQESADQKYLILYAFGAEGELLAGEMTIDMTDTLLGRVVHTGQLSGKDVILAESGIGMTNAAMTTQKIIDNYRPSTIIFSGIAGAIDSSVHIGDIVVADDWVTHDYGYHGAEGLKPGAIDVYSPGDNMEIEISCFHIDSALFGVASGLGEEKLELEEIGNRVPQLIIGGTAVSGNTFIDNVEKRMWLSENFHAKTVDMESAAVAQVAFVNDIPFIIFRSASDLAGGSGSESARGEIQQFFKVAAVNSARVVMEFLRKL